jgi:hypothetical protein
MYQPVLRVGILIPLYSRLSATEFATMPGGAPEVSCGGLDGRTSDSASDSDRKRFKTDSESSREQDSWSNNTSPGCDGRASPDARSAEQQASPSSESAASDGAKKAFVYFLTTYFKSLGAEFAHPSETSRAELASAPGRRPASRCMRHEPCRASAAASGDSRRAVARSSEGGGRHVFSPQAGFLFLCLRRGSTAASSSF